MRRLYLLCLFAFSIVSIGNAQSPPVACPANTQPTPAPFCSEACIVDNLDGYFSRNQWFPQWDVPPQFCAPQFHSINWIGFIAGTPQLTLRIQTYNCELPQRSGLQVGIFGTMDCSNFIQVSNCVPQFYNVTILDAQGLVPGRAYYLVIDGNENDICDFEVFVESGSTLAQPVFGDPFIVGPDSICVGSSSFYEIQGFGGGAGYFNWELEGIPISQEQFVTISGLAPGSYELCANPGNPVSGYGPLICKIIEVFALPAIAIDETVCIEDLPFNYQGSSFTAPGNYSFNTITPDGCEQAVELELTVTGPIPPTLVNANICLGDLYFIGNQIFGQPGIYPVVLTSQNGCDSLVELHLSGHPPSFTMLGYVVAPLPFLVGGVEVNTPGDFTVVLVSQYGCDSIVAGFLATLSPDTLFTDTTICQGDAIFFNMDTLTSSGIYLDTLISMDTATIQQLTLTVLPRQDTALTVSICQGEEAVVGGNTYNSTGLYRDTLTTANGCDSIIALNLTVLQPMDTIQATICEGQSYMLGNTTYTQAGVYNTVFTSPTGCQSMVQLQLNVTPFPQISLVEVLCAGDSLTVGSNTYTTSGTYSDTLLAANGCDSIVHTTLTILPPGSDTLTVSICEGNSLSFGGVDYTQSGLFCDTIPGGGTGGCDSIHCLNLTVLPNNTTLLDTAICEGESLFIGNSVYTTPGQYTDILTASNGCDSIIVLILDVLPVQETLLDEQICEGDTYHIGGQVLTNPGVYQITFPNSQSGCDSVVTLSLNVLPAVATELDTTLCPGQALFIGPYVFREPFQAELQFTGTNGCDSMLNLTLTYHDTIRLDTVIIEPDDEDFFGGSIEVVLTGGTPPYSYLWSDGRTEPYLDFLRSGVYFLMAADAHCSQGFRFKVPLRDELGAGPIIRRPGTGGGGIVVSPNPFNREIKVKLTGVDDAQATHLSLYNFAGQLVHEEWAAGISHRLQPQVPAGVYWLVAEQDGRRVGVERVVCVRR